jgi:hypothetical protein
MKVRGNQTLMSYGLFFIQTLYILCPQHAFLTLDTFHNASALHLECDKCTHSYSVAFATKDIFQRVLP